MSQANADRVSQGNVPPPAANLPAGRPVFVKRSEIGRSGWVRAVPPGSNSVNVPSRAIQQRSPDPVLVTPATKSGQHRVSNVGGDCLSPINLDDSIEDEEDPVRSGFLRLFCGRKFHTAEKKREVFHTFVQCIRDPSHLVKCELAAGFFAEAKELYGDGSKKKNGWKGVPIIELAPHVYSCGKALYEEHGDGTESMVHTPAFRLSWAGRGLIDLFSFYFGESKKDIIKTKAADDSRRAKQVSRAGKKTSVRNVPTGFEYKEEMVRVCSVILFILQYTTNSLELKYQVDNQPCPDPSCKHYYVCKTVTELAIRTSNEAASKENIQNLAIYNMKPAASRPKKPPVKKQGLPQLYMCSCFIHRSMGAEDGGNCAACRGRGLSVPNCPICKCNCMCGPFKNSERSDIARAKITERIKAARDENNTEPSSLASALREFGKGMAIAVTNSVKDLSRECVDLTEDNVQGAAAKELTKFQFGDDADLYHFRGLVGNKQDKFSDGSSYKDLHRKNKGVRYHNNGLKKGEKNEVSLIFLS